MSAAPTRFASLSEETKQTLVSNKDSKKTKDATKYAVNVFRQYLQEKSCDSDFEAFDLPTLDSKLRDFYAELRSTKGETYKRSTMVAIKGGLTRSLSQSRHLDIIKSEHFRSSNDMFTSMLKSISREGKGSVTHKLALSKADLDKLYRSIAFDTTTPTGLVQKVWFELCMYFCRRGRENQRDLTPQMLEIRKDETDGTEYVVQKNGEATKNHQGVEREVLDKNVRMYAHSGNVMCPVASLKKYLAKRNPECLALFQRPNDTFNDDDAVWYQNKPMGKNTLGKMMNRLSKAADLSATYTNHCVRSTAITALSHAGFEARHIMTVSGHRNEASVRSYVSDTTSTQKRQMSEALTDVTCGQSNTNVQAQMQTERDDFDDGLDAALCLSASQTEHLMDTISMFETNEPQPSSAVAEAGRQFVQSPSATSIGPNQAVTIRSVANERAAPVFNFNSCTVQLFNYSK